MAAIEEPVDIIGIRKPDGIASKTATIPFAPGMPLRMEISKLYRPADANATWNPVYKRQWTLYMYALKRFKEKPIHETLSYFQVAGIHGYPETSWNGYKPPNQKPVNPPPGASPFGGYCQHNSLVFPTWHRPYMLLFEQCLHEEMIEQIKDWEIEKELTMEEQKAWIDAADTWRLPYWDWARHQEYNVKLSVPQVLTLDTIKVQPPGEQKPVDMLNPLWEFENPLKGPDGESLTFGDADMGKWRIRPDPDPTFFDRKSSYALADRTRWDLTPRTGRYGIFLNQKKSKYIGLEGVNNFGSANSTISDSLMFMGGNRDDPKHPPFDPGTLSDCISRLFSKSYNAQWGTFASTKWKAEGQVDLNDKPTTSLSLESIHNQVHNLAGGVLYSTGMGHMSDVPVAAFDPLFWLHHCNIDRITAIWQVLHWDSWWDSEEPGEDNVLDKKPTDALAPFRTAKEGISTDYTSDMVRDWTKLYYQYDDLVPEPQLVVDGELTENDYTASIQAKMEALYPSTARFVNDIWRSKALDTPSGIDEERGQWNDYLINVVYDRYALNGRPYMIKFYIGGNPDATDAAQLYSNLVGQVYTFSAGTATNDTPGCANCTAQQRARYLSRAQVPITIRLLRDTLAATRPLATLTREDVIAYLRTNLHWKFVAYGGTELPAGRFKDASISVAAGKGVHRQIHFPPMTYDGTPNQTSTKVPDYVVDSYENLYEITKDKNGGAKGGYEDAKDETINDSWLPHTGSEPAPSVSYTPAYQALEHRVHTRQKFLSFKLYPSSSVTHPLVRNGRDFSSNNSTPQSCSFSAPSRLSTPERRTAVDCNTSQAFESGLIA